MKTAVCLSGLPREVEEVWRTFIDYFYCNLPSPDVFIHTGHDYCVDDFLKLLNLKSYVIEEQYKHIDLESLLAPVYYAESHLNSYVQQIYGLKRVWELKEQYAKENSIKYDIVVRTRPDYIYMRPITLDMFDSTKICTLHTNQGVHVPIEIAIGPDTPMSHFFKVYDWLVETNASYLTSTNPRLKGTVDNLYNCDIILATYLLDHAKVSIGVSKLADGLGPYDYYRIMYRHKLDLY